MTPHLDSNAPLALLLFAVALLGDSKQWVSFVLVHDKITVYQNDTVTETDDQWKGWIQPVLPMKLHLSWVSGPLVSQPETTKCRVFNVQDDIKRAHVRCGDTEYVVDGMAFEGEK